MGTRDKVADLLRDIAADEKDSWNTLYRFDAEHNSSPVVASILSKGTTGKAAESKMYLRVDTSEIGELTGAPTATGSAFAVSIPTVKGGVNNGECEADVVVHTTVRAALAWLGVIPCARVAPASQASPSHCVRARAAVTLALKSPAERDRLISIVSFLMGFIVKNAHDLVKAAPDDATVNPHNAILGCMYARFARAQEWEYNDDTVVHGVVASASQIPASFRQPFVAGFARALHPGYDCASETRAIVSAVKATPPLTPPFVNGLGWSEGLCKAIFDGLLAKDGKCRANYGGIPSTVDVFCTEAEVKKFALLTAKSTSDGLNNLASELSGNHVFAVRRLANECEWV